MQIFVSVQNWIKKNADRIADIEAVISFVRLHLMSCDQLLNIVRPSGLVKPDDLLQTFEMLNNINMSNQSKSKYEFAEFD